MSPERLNRGRCNADNQEVGGNLSASRTELRRRTRRVGLFYAAASPIVGAFFAILSRPMFGVLLGALILALGFYTGFAYAPLAERLRRREQSR